MMHPPRNAVLTLMMSFAIFCACACLGVTTTIAPARVASPQVIHAEEGYSLEYLGSFGGKVCHQVRHGNLAVVSLGSCIEIVDCADPAHPRRLARRWLEGRVTGLDFAGPALYLAVRNHGIRILDITNPANPTDRGGYTPYEMIGRLYYYELTISNQVLLIYGFYGKSYTSVEAVDINDLWNPRQIARHGNSRSGGDEADEEDKKVERLAGTSQTREEGTLDYHPPIQEFMEFAPVTPTLACLSNQECFTTNDLSDPDHPRELGRIALKSGTLRIRENIAILQNDSGIHFIDIGSTTRPHLLGSLKTRSRFDVDWPRTLMTQEETSLTLYDIHDLKHPRLAGHFTLPRPCEDFAIANHRLYAACLDLYVINLADPAHPQLEGSVPCEDPELAEHSKVYDGFRARDIAMLGRYAYCENSCVDLANPKAPQIIGTGDFKPPWSIDMNVYIRGRPLAPFCNWGTQFVTTKDHDEETVGTAMDIYDLSDPPHPQVAITLRGLDEKVKIAGDRLYLVGEESGVIICRLKKTPR